MRKPSRTYDCSFLSEIVPDDRVDFSQARREQFAVDASPHEPTLPDVVVWPESTEEVASILSEAHEREIPVTPWSGGSGLEGNAIAAEGGIILNTFNMDNVSVAAEDLQAVVGPGVIYDDLNETLGRHGLRFPPGIGSGDVATIGGMIATNASGVNAVKYGETRDHVRRLEVVLPDGDVVECGRDVVKTSSGYSLKDLFIGSEGTLGVITEATIEVSGIPEHRRTSMVTFNTPVDATHAVAEIIGFGGTPAAIEFVDTTTVSMINDYRPSTSLAEEPTLLIEFHSNNQGIEEDVEFARQICEENDATSWESAGEQDMDQIWEARSDALPAYRAYDNNYHVALLGDVVVPISKYPDIVETVAELSEEFDILTPCVGHAGDGNLHYAPIIPEDSEEAERRSQELNQRVVEAAIDVGGTATGEHGVGLGKRKFMTEEHGEALDVMRTIKDGIDPRGIMNPGKVLPAAHESNHR